MTPAQKRIRNTLLALSEPFYAFAHTRPSSTSKGVECFRIRTIEQRPIMNIKYAVFRRLELAGFFYKRDGKYYPELEKMRESKRLEDERRLARQKKIDAGKF